MKQSALLFFSLWKQVVLHNAMFLQLSGSSNGACSSNFANLSQPWTDIEKVPRSYKNVLQV